jgi:hypothetical protein
MSRSALLATMGDKQSVVTRLGTLYAGLNLAYDIAVASAGRITSYEGETTELRDLICRLRWRLLQARTAARQAEIGDAQTTAGSILHDLTPQS